MRKLFWVLLLLMPLSVVGQEPAKPNEAKKRTATLMAGLGNVFGWFGLHGERYFGDDHLSAFVGVGYTPAPEEFDPSGPTFAIGVRGFTPGMKHRGFLALSLSQLALLSAFDPEERARFYGPGLEAGYHYAAWGGFTFMASLGIGWAPGVPEGDKEVGEVLALGFGYTWRK